MGLIRAVLKHREAELDLNDPNGQYHLARGFTPPAVSLVPNIAAGTFANRFGGGELISMRATDRRWQFSVHVGGSSEAHVRLALQRLDAFLRRSRRDDPVYLHVRGSEDFPFEPKWGQTGADLRYQILYGVAEASDRYSFGFARNEELPECQVTLVVAPFATGPRQVLGFAQGGVSEERIGSPGGFVRGLLIPEATTNHFENPVFSQKLALASPWNVKWTAGANLIVVQNRDRSFIGFERWSSRLTATAATLNTYTENIITGVATTHTLSFYVKKDDGSAVTSADCEAYYAQGGGAQATTFTPVGNEWYRASATFTTILVGSGTGVQVKSGRTVYVDGFQLEEKAWPTPLAHGNMLGHAWTATELEHADPTDRAAGRLRIPWDDFYNLAEGSIRVVVKMPMTPADLGTATRYVLVDDSAGWSFYWEGITDRWAITDGTSTTFSASGQTWSVGDVLVFHLSWGESAIRLYLDGSLIATIQNYKLPSGNSWVYIGSTFSPAAHFNALFVDLASFADAMTATQITDDFNNLTEVLKAEFRPNGIPFLWTRNGDGRVENCDDGTKRNYAVAAGIPGTAPARARFKISPVTVWAAAADIWLSQIEVEEYGHPGGIDGAAQTTLWDDKGGTAETGACGGETQLLTGISDSVTATLTLQPVHYDFIAGRDMYLLVRLRDAGSGLLGNFRLYYDATNRYETGDKALAATTTQRLFVLGPLPALGYRGLNVEHGDPLLDGNLTVEFKVSRDNATANDVHVDFLMLLARPFALFQVGSLDVDHYYELEDGRLSAKHDGTNQLEGTPAIFVDTIGDRIELVPERYNLLMSMLGRDATDHQVDDENFDYDEVSVIPRWELL